jgi:hypothetical protein
VVLPVSASQANVDKNMIAARDRGVFKGQGVGYLAVTASVTGVISSRTPRRRNFW